MNTAPNEIVVGPYRMAWSERGTGAPVLAVHSSGLGARQWRKLADRLATTHCTVMPDLLGYGASGPWPDGVPFHLVLDVMALGKVLVRVDAPVHLVGHSYGGFLALAVALHHPSRVRTLSLYEPVCAGAVLSANATDALRMMETHADVVDDRADGSERWLRAFVAFWSGEGAWEQLGEAVRESFRAVSTKLAAEVRSLAADRTPHNVYAAIGAPVLLMYGSESPAVGRDGVQVLARAMPHATVQVIDGAGHMGALTHAGAVNELIARHVGG